MRFKDFEQLQKYYIKKDKKAKSLSSKNMRAKANNFARQEEKREKAYSENDLFLQEMQDVEPLDNKEGGREISFHHNNYSPPKKKKNQKQQGKKYLQDLVQGKVEFEIEFTDEYLHGNIKGLDPKIFKKLKSGEFSPEAHLDMHGLNLEDAHYSLVLFLKENYLNNKRCLLLIPGRGKNSPHGTSILRTNIQSWLTRDPLKRIILAFSTAQPQHGGAGALYVLLRKLKKNQGKIQWEKFLLDSKPE